MADVQPLRALHYDPAVVGGLDGVVAPPYDVIDGSQRQALLERSPYNVVAVDLPQPDPRAPERDQYEAAGELFERWQRDGALVRDEQPAVWAHTQDYTGPDGRARTRRGFFCRVRIEDYGPGRVRPHERTHPGPKEDRLRLTRATRANVSPIFSLYSDPTRAAWRALAPATEQPPWGEVTDADGTVHRLWRVSDPEAIAAVRQATREAELLIADGHHRYETMHEYARERDAAGGQAAAGVEGAAAGEPGYRYILMCLVALEDPGLTVFPTHRLIDGLDDARREALARALERDFEIEEVPLERIAPEPGRGPLELGYFEGRERRPLRLKLKSQAIADAALAGHSQAYRELDTGVLETLLLKNALGYSDEDIAHFNGMFYARDTEEALAMVRSGRYEAAFLMRPTPVEQVRDVAAAGENMPPKSTYFYPKLLTGLLFNPLDRPGRGVS
ncbi:MAG TPA: DUF1015 domain-containing protein [Solirubrobacteraceae bacterium]|jgi:uncharacterized protein (DUF1015 family)|nr:DUF1015 domain-containing protein [Solirubrobacteraceae bacterium]